MKKHFSFFVSCQALPGEALYGRTTMLKMAKAVLDGGASGIRTSQINNINLIKSHYPEVPVIGLIKKNYADNPVFITPTLKELKALMKTDAEYLALDGTIRKRPKESLKELVEFFNLNNKKNQRLMADCATLEDVKYALSLGIDVISTTLRGYTVDTKGISNVDNDYEFLKQCKELLAEHKKCVLVAEGGFNTPEDLKAAYEIGVDIAVIGSAITRPKFITEQFIKQSGVKL